MSRWWDDRAGRSCGAKEGNEVKDRLVCSEQHQTAKEILVKRGME